jgi:hypothetical protein
MPLLNFEFDSAVIANQTSRYFQPAARNQGKAKPPAIDHLTNQ